MSDTMNETHIHDPRPLARSEIESVLQLSRETAYVPREDRPGIKDKSFVKRPLVDIAQAADAPVTPDTPATPDISESPDLSASPAMPEEEAGRTLNPETEGAPASENVDASAGTGAGVYSCAALWLCGCPHLLPLRERDLPVAVFIDLSDADGGLFENSNVQANSSCRRVP